MRYRAVVEVTLLAGYFDPEGETVKSTLGELGFSEVSSVRVGKIYYLDFEASSTKDARRKIDEMCKKLLVNPVKDAYKLKIERIKKSWWRNLFSRL